jgi:hypothetical protein
MRLMVLGKAAEANAGAPPTKEAFAAMDRFIEELVKAGVLVAGAGLKADASAKRVSVTNGKATIIDGPFAETRELVAGFQIWEVKDMDEALAWVKRYPMSGDMELRPFMEAADLADYVSPDELATPRTGERGKLGVA